MNSSSQQASPYSSIWEANRPSLESEGVWSKLPLRQVIRFCFAAIRTMPGRLPPSTLPPSAVQPNEAAAPDGAHPSLLSRVRRTLPFLHPEEKQEVPEMPDAVQTILADFDALDEDRKDKVARNLVLLWDNFQEVFGGMSSFLEAPEADRGAFINKLNAAAERMAPARGTEAAFHYVTVELMRQYISFFQVGRSDRKAVALATCVAALIDRGREIEPEPKVYSVKA